MKKAVSLDPVNVREGYIPVRQAALYFRATGWGRPIIALHGGPDFAHCYLLPELDRLADRYRLICYDQRGRGLSAALVQPAEVTIESELADLDCVLDYHGLDAAVLLGHSWGCLLALEYAARRPERVSHLILLNTAPVSHADYLLLRSERRRSVPDDIAALEAMAGKPRYLAGDPGTVAAYYRVHFRSTLRQPDQLDLLIERLQQSFTPHGILKARAIESRLIEQTWLRSEYSLLPRLAGLGLPTLVIHGDYDFVPVCCAEHVATAIDGSRMLLLPDCGHFSYLEQPDAVGRAIDALLGAA